jgi:hypothetical protein
VCANDQLYRLSAVAAISIRCFVCRRKPDLLYRRFYASQSMPHPDQSLNDSTVYLYGSRTDRGTVLGDLVELDMQRSPPPSPSHPLQSQLGSDLRICCRTEHGMARHPALSRLFLSAVYMGIS